MYCEWEDERTLALAEAKIDELTFDRIKERGYEELTDFQKELVRLACLLQCQYIEEGCEGISKIEVEDFSVTLKEGGECGTSPEVISLLKQTGLMCRAI